MSTLAQLITAVRDEISEPVPGFWTDAEITRWLNRANYDLTDASGLESATSFSIVTVVGQEAYALPAGFGLVEQIELVDTSDPNAFYILKPIHIEDRMDQSGYPAGYYVLGGQLFITPKPDAAYTLRLWYYQTGVTLVNGTDVPIISAKYHDLLTLFGISEAKKKADDPAWAAYRDDYVSGREGMIEYLRQKGLGNRFAQVLDEDER